MSNTKYTIDEDFVVRDFETLKVVADSLRMQILDLLRENPLTVKQLAAELDIAPTKLYYHINLMEKHGLIRVVDTRMVSGILEKRYYATARYYSFDHHLLSPNTAPSTEGLDMMLSTVFDEPKADLKKSVQAGLVEFDLDNQQEGVYPLVISRLISRLTDEQAKDFRERLQTLLKEFAELRIDPHNAEEQGFAMVLCMYPTTRVPLHPHSTEEVPVVTDKTSAPK
jgi:DNA-binding transcriptional ArsR family regulator